MHRLRDIQNFCASGVQSGVIAHVCTIYKSLWNFLQKMKACLSSCECIRLSVFICLSIVWLSCEFDVATCPRPDDCKLKAAGISQCRQTLLEVAAAGPAAGATASLICLLAGLGLSAAGFGGIEVEPSAFEDSLLVGLLGMSGSGVPPVLTK